MQNEAGEPIQVIHPETSFALSRVDLSSVDREEQGQLLAEIGRVEAQTSFDFEQGPLIRGQLIDLGVNEQEEPEYVLLATMHHIVSDGWSMGIFSREITALYEAYVSGKENPLTPLEIQYADYAHWQRSTLAEEGLGEQLSYWQGQLSDAPELLTLPWDRARPAQQDYRGGSVDIQLGVELTEQLKALAQSKGMTLYMVLLSAWGMLLSRLSGQETVVVGTPVANRPRAELEGLIGFFVNSLAIRLDVNANTSLSAYLTQVRERTLGAYEHQDVPFEQVVELVSPERSRSHSPLYQVEIGFERIDDNVEIDIVDNSYNPDKPVGVDNGDANVPFDLVLSLEERVSEQGVNIQGNLLFASTLFDSTTITRWASYFKVVLENLVKEDNQSLPVGTLPILPEKERNQLLNTFNDTSVEFSNNRCIHDLFEEQVVQTPDAIALVYRDQALSYCQLNESANKLGHYLVEHGVANDSLVCICMERSLEMIVALLGVLKAGGAYVPIAPSEPSARIEHILEDTQAEIILTQLRLFVDLPVSDQQIVCVDLVDTFDDKPLTNIPVETSGLSPLSSAYVIYTSGTTGRPKGVLNHHRGLCNLVQAQIDRFELMPDSRVLQFASFGFDASVWEWGMSLCSGATLYIVDSDDRVPGAPLLKSLSKSRITHITLPPSVLEVIAHAEISSDLTDLSHLIVAGEASSKSLAEQWSIGRRYFNAYGPSETSVCASIYEYVDGTAFSIGSPIHNVRMYILDNHGETAPLGVAGEIHIGGVGVAREYLRREELTNERFIRDPFTDDPQARLYRTGDLGSWNSDGTINFLGRIDDQLKIRGYRVESGEIESRLREQANVKEALVLLLGEGSNRYIVGYLTPKTSESINIEEVRADLRNSVPEYMVPRDLIVLDTFPLTTNGKIDRKALPVPDGSGLSRGEYEAPLDDLEQALAEIWEELLQAKQVGRRDNFFDLGGHSLLAVQLVARIEQGVSRTLSLKSLFDRPLLLDMARELRSSSDHDYIAIEIADREQPLPLSWSQQRLWFIAQLDEQASLAYHIPASVRLTGELNQEALNQTLSTLLERHEVLRTTIMQNGGGEPVQVIHPETSFALSRVDLSSVDREEQGQRLAEIGQVEAQTSFDFEQGPLIRGQLIDIGVNERG